MQQQRLYTVTQVVGRIILDQAGNAVQGYHIDFTTMSGMRGFVEMPAAQYNIDSGKSALELAAKRLEEILKL